MHTIKMKRDPEAFPAPHFADVHPDEVENYRAGGFVPADPLDHDGDGKPGGSLPGEKATARKPRAKKATD